VATILSLFGSEQSFPFCRRRCPLPERAPLMAFDSFFPPFLVVVQREDHFSFPPNPRSFVDKKSALSFPLATCKVLPVPFCVTPCSLEIFTLSALRPFLRVQRAHRAVSFLSLQHLLDYSPVKLPQIRLLLPLHPASRLTSKSFTPSMLLSFKPTPVPVQYF